MERLNTGSGRLHQAVLFPMLPTLHISSLPTPITNQEHKKEEVRIQTTIGGTEKGTQGRSSFSADQPVFL
jgi:hypothetical protein